MYNPNKNRYDNKQYSRCGKSGLRLPPISLGLWQNFSHLDSLANMEQMIFTAFDSGITHFDLANNYGNPYNGSAEENFGAILDRGLRRYRHELCISTKAGYEMWDGPYGDKNGSRKYLITSLEQSLQRMRLDYVDVFYHHVFDPDTPLEETAVALNDIARQGKAIYIGLSNYNRQNTAKMIEYFAELHTPFVVNQPPYSMLNRGIEDDGLDKYALEKGFGLAVFSPLHRGILTSKYLGSSGANSDTELSEKIAKAEQLNAIASERGQTLSQMALAWVLNNPAVTTAIIGASKPEQILDNIKATENTRFTDDEISRIDDIITLSPFAKKL